MEDAVALNFSKSMLATALVLGMMSTAHAYTAEQQQLCTDDAFRLCSADIPDVDRITACMARHKADLSPACRAVFGRPDSDTRASVVPATNEVKASKPLNLVPQKIKRSGA